MDDKHKTDKQIKITEPEDLLLVVEKMKSIPRIKPSRLFNAKVAFFSMFPTAWLLLTEDHPVHKLSERLSEPVHLRHKYAARYSTVAAVALVAALLIFSGLTLAARDSNPGDLLYSFKRARENIQVAFTFDRSKKVKKTLSLAETRLDELDHVINEDNPNPACIREVIEDYDSKVASVDHDLAEGKLAGSGNIEARLNAVETAKDNLQKRLVAAAPTAILTPAEDARVTVKDSQGAVRFGKDGNTSASGETDNDGNFSFTAEVDDIEAAGNMEVTVEADGRTAVVPAYYPAAPVIYGPYQASVTPQSSTIKKGQSQTYKLTLSQDGAAAAGKTIRLSDLSHTGNIDGKVSQAVLETDKNGDCVFEVTKTSVGRPSRISLEVLNGDWKTVGEVLALGSVDIDNAENTAAPAVTTRTTGTTAGGRNIVMENGLITVSVNDKNKDIITGCSSTGSDGDSSRVTEPLLSGSNNNTLTEQNISKPALISSGPGEAAYEVSYEIAGEDAILTKTYVVTLKRGQPYASIDCTLNLKGSSEQLNDTIFDICRVPFAAGSVAEIAGNEATIPDDGKPSVFSFNRSKPYAGIESSEKLTFISSPSWSGDNPESWILGSDYIQMRPNERLLQGGKSIKVSAIIAPDSSKYSEELEKYSTSGAALEYKDTASRSDTPMGFVVATEPSGNDIKSGSQRFTITVYKEYEKLLD